jgi:hypothetical protein
MVDLARIFPAFSSLKEDEMADNRYGGHGRREGWHERGSSIFPDDDDRWGHGGDRWARDRDGRGGSDDDRGFLERAGDEVRSWFGDEEAERRREMDARRDEGRSPYGGHGREDQDRGGRGETYGSRTPYGGSAARSRRASSAEAPATPGLATMAAAAAGDAAATAAAGSRAARLVPDGPAATAAPASRARAGARSGTTIIAAGATSRSRGSTANMRNIAATASSSSIRTSTNGAAAA